MNKTKQARTETPRRTRRARAAFGGLCAALVAVVAAPVVAVSATDAPAPPAPPLGQFSFCDFAGTGSETEHDCKRDLLSPKRAKQVDVRGTALSQAERDALAASADDPAPIIDGDADPVSFGEAKGATSPTAHADLSASESLQLFEHTYDVLLEEIATDPLPADAEIVEVADENTVVIEQPGEGTSLVDSPEPLVAGSNDKPIDLDLTDTGPDYAPERPLTDVSLPDNAYESAELTAAGVSFSYAPADASGGSDGLAAEPVGEEGLFYPKADTDTDLFLTPKATGFELFAQLRSEESPEQLRVEVEMPAGAVLTESEELPGAVEIRDGAGAPLAAVNPPFATEASGDPFPVTMSVEGASTLLLEVAHRGSGTGYPILVDPEVNDLMNWSSGYVAGTNWTSSKTDPDFLQWEQLQDTTWLSRGLYNIAPTSTHFGAATEAAWNYWVPNYAGGPSSTSAYISDAWMGSWFATGATGQGSPMVVLGQAAPGAGWVRQKIHTQAYGQYGNWMSATTSLQPGRTQTESKRLAFRLWNSVNLTTNTQRTAQLNNVHVKLDDLEAPSADITAIDGWVDGSSDLTATNEAEDGGLGVKSQSFLAGVDENGDNVNLPGVSSSCDGTPDNPCPQSWDEDFTIDPSQLRDGLQIALSGTVDAVGKGVMEGEWYGIDREAPVVDGLLVEEDESIVSVEVDVSDGDPGARDTSSPGDLAGARSGVARVDLVNGSSVIDSAEQICQGDGIAGNGTPSAEVPWQSCELSASLVAADGSPATSLSLVVTDAAGNAESFPLDTTPPTLETEGELPETGSAGGDGFAELGITVSDAGSEDSGIERIMVEVDDSVALTEAVDCAVVCPPNHTLTWAYTESTWGPGEHSISVTVQDAMGNVEEQTFGVNLADALAACPAGTPTSQPAGDTVSTTQATDAAPASSVAPATPVSSEEVDSFIDPSLDPGTGGAPMEATGSLSEDEVPTRVEDGIVVGGMICMVPSQTTSSATDADVVNGDSAVYANTATDTDTIVRPNPAGETIIQSLRGSEAPDSFSWDVGIPAGTELRELSNGDVAVVDPSGSIGPEGDGDSAGEQLELIVPPDPAGGEDPVEVADAEVELDDTMHHVAAAEAETGLFVVSVMQRPYAIQQDGSSQPATITVDDTNTVTVASAPGSNPEAVVLRARLPINTCWKWAPLNTFYAGVGTQWYFNNATCVTKSKRGVFAKYLTQYSFSSNHVSARLQARVHKGRNRVIRRSPEIVNPDISQNPEKYVQLMRTPPAHWRGYRRYCARLWQHTRAPSLQIVWRGLSKYACAKYVA